MLHFVTVCFCRWRIPMPGAFVFPAILRDAVFMVKKWLIALMCTRMSLSGSGPFATRPVRLYQGCKAGQRAERWSDCDATKLLRSYVVGIRWIFIRYLKYFFVYRVRINAMIRKNNAALRWVLIRFTIGIDDSRNSGQVNRRYCKEQMPAIKKIQSKKM